VEPIRRATPRRVASRACFSARRASAETAGEAHSVFLDSYERLGAHHFRAEEELLLPAYARHAACARPEVVRVLTEHALVIPPRSGLIGQPAFPGMVTESADLVVLAVQAGARPDRGLGRPRTRGFAEADARRRRRGGRGAVWLLDRLWARIRALSLTLKRESLGGRVVGSSH
jgi:hypothetical protein